MNLSARLAAPAAALALAACSTLPPARTGPPVAVDPAAAGWDPAALHAVVAYVGRQRSTGFVVIDDRRILVDRRWPVPAGATGFRAGFVHGTTADGVLLEDVASQQKSFVALLAGIAIDRGLLDPSRSVSSYVGAGWSKAAPADEAAITVRNLLEMNSGLKEDLSRDVPPDTRFLYNTPAYAILKPVLVAASGRPLDEITQAWLAGPAGMRETAWRRRPAQLADVGNPTGLVTTPRDVAIMGQLVLDGGVAADGTRVISTAQLDALFVRTRTNPAYGRLWWLNGGTETVGTGADSPRRAGPYIVAAPADLVAAVGALDRKLFVVPSRRLVVVRTGMAAPDRRFNETLWTLLERAMPAR